jgi:hypothetical protein
LLVKAVDFGQLLAEHEGRGLVKYLGCKFGNDKVTGVLLRYHATKKATLRQL